MIIFTPNTVIKSADINTNFAGLADGSEINAGAITNAKFNTAQGEFGGTWLDWTPTFTATGGTAPTYTQRTGRYMQIGKTVYGTFTCQNTTGGTAGNGAVLLTISVPVNIKSTTVVCGFGYSYEAAGTLAGGGILRYASASSLFMQRTDTFTNILANDQSSADRAFNGTFIYEAA